MSYQTHRCRKGQNRVEQTRLETCDEAGLRNRWHEGTLRAAVTKISADRVACTSHASPPFDQSDTRVRSQPRFLCRTEYRSCRKRKDQKQSCVRRRQAWYRSIMYIAMQEIGGYFSSSTSTNTSASLKLQVLGVVERASVTLRT